MPEKRKSARCQFIFLCLAACLAANFGARCWWELVGGVLQQQQKRSKQPLLFDLKLNSDRDAEETLLLESTTATDHNTLGSLLLDDLEMKNGSEKIELNLAHLLLNLAESAGASSNQLGATLGGATLVAAELVAEKTKSRINVESDPQKLPSAGSSLFALSGSGSESSASQLVGSHQRLQENVFRIAKQTNKLSAWRFWP